MSKKAKIKKAKEKFYERVTRRMEAHPRYVLPEISREVERMCATYESPHVIRKYIEEKVYYGFFGK